MAQRQRRSPPERSDSPLMALVYRLLFVVTLTLLFTVVGSFVF
jgi:hypothetical protein